MTRPTAVPANMEIDKTAYDGGLDPVAYRRIGDVLREARAKRAHFGQPPAREVGAVL